MAFFSVDNQIKRRQMELAEREQRLQNDPGRIFLNSLSRTAPQALLGALGDVGVNMASNYAKYNWFGGKEAEKMISYQPSALERYLRAEEGKTNPLSYQQFLRDYNLLGPALDQPSNQARTSYQAKNSALLDPRRSQPRGAVPTLVEPLSLDNLKSAGGKDSAIPAKVPTSDLTVEQIEQQKNQGVRFLTPDKEVEKMAPLPKPDSLIKEEPSVVTLSLIHI